MPITHGQGNPDWTWDETILALDLVLQHWPKIPGSKSAEVKALSALIRRLPVHPDATKNDRFRNPDGVYLKLQNLVSLHPSKRDRKGLRTSHMDRAVWKQYWSQPDLVSHLAAQIAKGIEEIEAGPPEDRAADDGFEGQEGAVLARVHRFRERKHGFRRRLLKEVERRYGSLRRPVRTRRLARPWGGLALIALPLLCHCGSQTGLDQKVYRSWDYWQHETVNGKKVNQVEYLIAEVAPLGPDQLSGPHFLLEVTGFDRGSIFHPVDLKLTNLTQRTMQSADFLIAFRDSEDRTLEQGKAAFEDSLPPGLSLQVQPIMGSSTKATSYVLLVLDHMHAAGDTLDWKPFVAMTSRVLGVGIRTQVIRRR